MERADLKHTMQTGWVDERHSEALSTEDMQLKHNVCIDRMASHTHAHTTDRHTHTHTHTPHRQTHTHHTYVHIHTTHTHTHTPHTHHTYPIPMYSLPLISHATPQKGGSKTRVQLLGRLRLFSWAIADWSSCLTPLCKDDGKFTGRGASSPQGKVRGML